MNKWIMMCCACIFAFTAGAQEWPTVKIDSAVSVQLPAGFAKTDTANKVQVLASSDFGTIMVFKSDDDPETTTEIDKDSHLEKYYKNYVDAVSSSAAGGNIINEKSNLLGNLKVKDFTLKVDSGGGEQYRDFKVLHANGATYTFEFLYGYLHKNLVKPEKDKFFKSISVTDNVDRQDQYTSVGMAQENQISPVWIFGAGTLILTGILFFIFRRKRLHSA
jgi:hypothetical protein